MMAFTISHHHDDDDVEILVPDFPYPYIPSILAVSLLFFGQICPFFLHVWVKEVDDRLPEEREYSKALLRGSLPWSLSPYPAYLEV